MKKIISLFQRNYDGDRLVRNAILPGAEWVVAGEGVATRKWDGTCCMVRDARLYKRYEVKAGRKPPENFEPATDVDENTGKQQGWVPVGHGPEDQWFREAFNTIVATEYYIGPPQFFMLGPAEGTYELCGPKINGNPEGLGKHVFIEHGKDVLADCPRDFDGLKAYLAERDIEGIVWHHEDGRMVKIKGKDFGIRRNRG